MQGMELWQQEMPTLLKRTATQRNAALRSPHGFTALQAACLAGDTELIEALIANGAPAETRPDNWEQMGMVGNTPLGMLLINQEMPQAERYRMARLLLEHGANPDTLVVSLITPYHIRRKAAAFNTTRDHAMQLLLLEFGEQDFSLRFSRKGNDKRLSIHWPACSEKLIRRLVEGGVNPNSFPGGKDHTLLKQVVADGNVALLQFLLEHGADARGTRSRYGNLPLFCIPVHTKHLVFGCPKRNAPIDPDTAIAIAQMLLEHGADIHALDNRGNGLRIHYGEYDTPAARALCRFFKEQGAELHPDASPEKRKRPR